MSLSISITDVPETRSTGKMGQLGGNLLSQEDQGRVARFSEGGGHLVRFESQFMERGRAHHAGEEPSD
jgi:hypothetical protein